MARSRAAKMSAQQQQQEQQLGPHFKAPGVCVRVVYYRRRGRYTRYTLRAIFETTETDKLTQDSSEDMRERKKNAEGEKKSGMNQMKDDGSAFATQLCVTREDLFKSYPSLMTKDDLVAKYPWCAERITYAYVFTSYREPNNSTTSCLYALFTVHNELINAWTHWIGVLISIASLCVTLLNVHDIAPRAVLSIICFSGIFMFSSSATYHTFCCQSDMVCRRVQCLDWLGIAVHTFSSNLVVSYFELKQFPNVFYGFTVVNFLFAVFTYSITFSALQKVYAAYEKKYGKADECLETRLGGDRSEKSWFALISAIIESYAFRSLVAMSYGLGSMVAWFIGYGLTGVVNEHLKWIIAMYGCFGMVVLCLVDFPEKFVRPGVFDIVGSSHQVFHCGIIAGYFLLWYYFFSVALAEQK